MNVLNFEKAKREAFKKIDLSKMRLSRKQKKKRKLP
jgi:hypothetical protein